MPFRCCFLSGLYYEMVSWIRAIDKFNVSREFQECAWNGLIIGRIQNFHVPKKRVGCFLMQLRTRPEGRSCRVGCLLIRNINVVRNYHDTHVEQPWMYENNRFFISLQVDNSETLAEFCGLSCRKGQLNELSCALVTRSEHSPWAHSNDEHLMSQAEQTLTDFYECTMYAFPRPTIKLPPLSWAFRRTSLIFFELWFRGIFV